MGMVKYNYTFSDEELEERDEETTEGIEDIASTKHEQDDKNGNSSQD